MCPVPLALNWFDSHQYLALWLEGIALLAIFVWDRRDASQQHGQTLAQMEIMRNQALATETAANAANKSAEALIKSERAWVVVEILPVCRMVSELWCRPAGSSWAALSDDEISKGHHLRHTMKLTNMGRTPAQILRFQIGYSHLPERVTELPEGSVGELVEAREFGHPLGAAESIEVQEPVIDVFDNLGSTVDQIRAVNETRATLVVHGWLEYQHVFDSKNTERVDFCYSYSPKTCRLNKVARPKQPITFEGPTRK